MDKFDVIIILSLGSMFLLALQVRLFWGLKKAVLEQLSEERFRVDCLFGLLKAQLGHMSKRLDTLAGAAGGKGKQRNGDDN